MYRRQVLALCAASAGALAGCPSRSGDGGSGGETPPESPDDPSPDGTGETTPSSLDGSWESYQHDAASTGSTDDPGPVAEPSERWRRTTLTGGPATSPAAVNGAFVVVARSGAVYALEAADGSVRWRGARTVETNIAPVALDGTVVVADGETLVGIGSETGETRWTVDLDGTPVELAAADGRIVAATGREIVGVASGVGTVQWRRSVDGSVTTVGAGDGTIAVSLSSGSVLGLDAGSGRDRWRESIGGKPTFAPAVGNGRVYLVRGSRLVALDGPSGDEVWTHETAYPIATSPAVTGEAVYLSTVNEEAEPKTPAPSADGTPTPHPTDTLWFGADVRALAPADGHTLWRSTVTDTYNFTSGPPEMFPIVATDDRVIVCLNGTLHAYDATTGGQAWSAPAGGRAPAVTDGVVSTGHVGIDLAGGARTWRFRTGDSVISAPAVVGNTVYVGSDDNHLYALEATTGTPEWAARTDDIIRAAPAVGDDAVYVGTINGTLYALDRADGTELWRSTLGGDIRAPTLHDGTLYVGNFSRTLFALDAADGTEAWRTTVESDRFVALEVAVADGAVYAGTNGDLRAFETADGTTRWSVLVGDDARVQSPPVAADGRVYVNIGDAVRAYDTADGTEVWTHSIAGNANDPPVVNDGVVYASSDEAVHAVDAADGTEQWQTPVGNTLKMAATGDAVYGWGLDTPLVALDPDDGSWLWQTGGFEPRSPLAVAGDYLFVGDNSGSVRALGPTPD